MRYILFVKEACPYCKMAADLLEEKGLDYSQVVFEKGQEEVLEQIKSAHNWKTVPMIFCREGSSIDFIGGYTDLAGCVGDARE